MPAIMDDPSSPTIYRISGQTPFPDPSQPELPPNVLPRQVILRDRQTIATVVPFASRHQVPASLLAYLSDQFAKEIEGGDTYPMIDPMPLDKFSAYWFQNFGAIMLLGQIESAAEVVEGKDWSRECLGSFYIKPNYPGRSSHVCNGGFLVTDASRNRGVGRLMGECYLDWAPKLGYTYSVFNLVYETNVASCKIWDGLGFKRIGRVKGCGNLKSYPDRLIDAIIYGRELGQAADGGAGGAGDPLLVSEERFDKIKFYLKFSRYPKGSDRAEKSRLRSAATHYKLLDNDVLMLKDKEVISDPVRQMDISRRLHEAGGHAGINKTTATIAERYHWSRIKETVSDVIRTCDQCKEAGKTPSVQNPAVNSRRLNNVNTGGGVASPLSRMSPLAVPVPGSVEDTGRVLDLQTPAHSDLPPLVEPTNPYAHASDITSLLNPPMQAPSDPSLTSHHDPMIHSQLHHDSAATLASLHEAVEMYHPIDPQIISQTTHHQPPTHHHPHAFNTIHPSDAVHSTPHPSHTSLSGHETYSPHDAHSSLHTSVSFSDPIHPPPHHHHPGGPHHEPDSFQALLHGAVLHHQHQQQQHHQVHHQQEDPTDHNNQVDQDAVDRDIDMLINHGDDSEIDIDIMVGDHDPEPDGHATIDGKIADEDSAARADAAAVKRSSIYNVVFNDR